MKTELLKCIKKEIGKCDLCFIPFEVKDSQIGLMQGVNHKDLYTVKLHLRIQTPPYPMSQKKKNYIQYTKIKNTILPKINITSHIITPYITSY